MGCNSSKDGYESQDHSAAGNADDPKKSAVLRDEALKVAEEMMGLTRGKRFHEFYTRLTLTSYGASCKVLTAYHRTTSKKVAVKTIPKSRKQLDRQRQKVMLEIGTFRMVEDHPNAVRVLEIFEGAECYYIVMECCEGGELFDHISKKQGCFTERQAAGLLRSLMLFLAHMHSKGIAHLDIKPENLMFDSEGASGVLKVLDFGSSVFVQPNETVRNAFGTVRYASPEMANDVCGQKADIWSAGVVMYILLCGRAPFLKSNDIDTLNYIKNGPRVKFSGERWTTISQSAKDCIRTLLEPNPKARPTAAEVLTMPWLKQQVPETVIVPDTLKHLRTFANQSRIRRLLLGLMADQLVGSGANQLLGQFYSLDKDFSGTLEVSELVKAAKEAIPDLSEHEINRMFEALDVDRTGTVDVKEFFAGLIQTIDEEKQTLVAQKSFTMLDKRGSGYVTKEVFMEVLMERAKAGTLKMLGARGGAGACELSRSSPLTAEQTLVHGRQSGGDGVDSLVILDPGLVHELETEFADLDANGDGVLSFEEFKAILGIQSTPEGLTLTQPQLAAVPSLQEGMETLAQTLRTRTHSMSRDEQARQASVQRLTLSRASQSGGGGLGGVAGGGGSTTLGLPRPAGAGGGVGGGRISSSGVAAQPLSVDRAQLDLELPYEMETRDLLQLLAPAKRTASQVPLGQSQLSISGALRGAGASGGGGAGGGGANSAATTASGAAAAGVDPPAHDGRRSAPRSASLAPLETGAARQVSRPPSSNSSIPIFSLLDKVPSLRVPSLPPLPARPGLEFDALEVCDGSPGGQQPVAVAARAGRESPLSRHRPGGGGLFNSSYSGTPGEQLSQVRWRDPPSVSSTAPLCSSGGGGSCCAASAATPVGLACTALGVAEAVTGTATASAVLEPVPSPRSSVRQQPIPALAPADKTPLLGGLAGSSEA